MSMSVNAAQDEFNALLARNRPRSKERRSEDALSTASERSSGRSSPRSSNSSANHRPSTSTGPRPLPRMDGANTGPKGVIADAIAFNKARKNTVRQTFVTLSNTISEKISTPKTQSRGDSRDKDSSTDEDEDDFVRTWRMNRMAELHTGAVVRNRRNSPSKRRWGTITKVTPIGYLDAIERVTADTTVVVFINDEDSAVSDAVEGALLNVARKHETTRFVKLNYEDAEIDAAAVPAILAYRNGELFANLVSIIDEIPPNRDLSPNSLEDVLQHYSVLP